MIPLSPGLDERVSGTQSAGAGPSGLDFGNRFRASLTPPYQLGPGSVRETVEFIQWAESLGYDDVWLADAGGIDPLTLAALVLDSTTHIRVGIAAVPAYTRTPAVLAATIATLADIAPGRFALGLGTSSEAMLEGWHGLHIDKPVDRMRETLELLRDMLAGKKTQFDGVTLRSRGYLQPAVAQPVPILLAALGPRMSALAATAYDGVILNLFPFDVLESLVGRIREHARSSGRDPGAVEIASRLSVLVTDDISAGRDAFRRQFAPYYVNPVYNRFLASCGYPDEAAAILAAGRAGDWAGARAALTDDLVDAVAITGDAAHCARRIQTYAQAGVTTPILGCPALDPSAHRENYLALAPALCRAPGEHAAGGDTPVNAREAGTP
jgi:probable F420-dependent oxidoreductase